MSLETKSEPVVITVRPTSVTVRKRRPETVVIRPRRSGPGPMDDWNARFKPAVIVGSVLTIVTWLVSLVASYFSTTASFWIGLLGLLTTGAGIYRELFRNELIPHWIVGVGVALAPFLITSVLNLLPFFSINPGSVAVIGLGLLIGAVAHCLGLLKPSRDR